MSHLTQMAGLAVQNFVSAAVGHRGRVALDPRAHRRRVARRSATSGSTSRATIDARAAAARVRARARARQPGRRPEPRTGHAGARRSRARPSRSPGGPVASQEAIKELGTNGGGLFNANSAHPFENPTPFTNLLEIFALLLDPVRAHVRLRPARRRPAPGLGGASRRWSRSGRRRRRSRRARDRRATRRLEAAGASSSAGTWRARRCGSARPRPGSSPPRRPAPRPARSNSRARQLHAARRRRPARQHDARRGQPRRGRRRPLRDAVFALLSVFIAGLMVGRTPEYLGKKIQATEMKLVVLYLLAVPSLSSSSRAIVGRARPARRRRSSTPGRTASPRSSTPSRRPRTTTAPRSAA